MPVSHGQPASLAILGLSMKSLPRNLLCILAATQTLSQAWAAEHEGKPVKTDKGVAASSAVSMPVLIAAGQIKTPAPIQYPSSSPPPSTLGTPLKGPITPQPADLIPPQGNQPENPPVELKPANTPQGSVEQTKPVMGTIEINEQAPLPLTPDKLPDGSLSLPGALNEALLNSPRASAIRAQLPVAKAGLAQATVGPNPIFFFDRSTLSEQVRRVGPVMTVDLPWKIVFRMLAAKRLYDQTRIDLMNNLWVLRASVRRTYTEVVLAQETQKTLEELYNLTEKLLGVSEKRFQAGDVPELDVLRARLASSQTHVDLNVGRQRVIRAKQQLDVILGRKVDDPISVPHLPEYWGTRTPFQLNAVRVGILPDFSLAVPPLQTFVGQALENRLELKSLNQQLRVNKMNLVNAYANVVPNPTVAMGSSVAGNPPIGPKIKANFVTVNLECPFNNMNQGNITQFKSTGNQLKYQIGSQKNVIISEVSSAYNNLLAAREKIRVYQEHVLNDSYEVARLSRRSYEVGQSDINATLLAQQANVQIRSQYLDAVGLYQQAFTDLEQACGRPLQ